MSGLRAPDATVAKLKKQHGDIEICTVKLPRSGAAVEFIAKRPDVNDWEMSEAAQAAGGPDAANIQLLGACIVYPDRGAVLDQLREQPVAVAQWVEDWAAPFLGGGATMTTVAVPEDDEDTAALQAEHGPLMRTSISYPRSGGRVTVFTWRRPVFDDWETAQSVGRPGAGSAVNQKALLAVAVDPSRAEILAGIRRYPIAVAAWVTAELLPFFGHGAKITSRAL